MKHRKPPWLKLFVKLLTARPESRIEVFKLAAACGDVVKTFGKPSAYFFNHPEAIRHIFTHHEPNFTKEGSSYQRLESCIGKGLLTNFGSRWKAMRDEVQPQFHYKHLVPYLPLIGQTTKAFLDDWQDRVDTTVDIVHEMSKLVLQISSITLFAADVHAKSEAAIPYIRLMNEHIISAAFPGAHLPLPSYRKYHIAQNFIDKLTVAMLNAPHPYASQLQAALKNLWLSEDLTDDERQRRIDEAKNFIIAGHETTAAALSWALYLLSKHPDCLSKILDEIDKVLLDDIPTLEQLDQLTYTEMVINETLRLYPPIWIIERRVIDDDIVQDYFVPAKSKALMCIYTLHRHKEFWPDPEKFDPERFNSTNRQHRHKYAYIPFGAGPRVCIGKQLAMLMMKSILPMLLQRFHIAIDPEFTDELDELVTLKPKNPMWNVIRSRADRTSCDKDA